MYQREFYYEIGKKVGYVALIAFLLLYFRKKARKLFAALGNLITPAVAPRSVSSQAEPEVEPIEDEEPATIRPEKRPPTLTQRMQETAKNQPEEIAKVMKTMMVE
jgi:flagellar biosynthesis/type III secretory pathway M-ring protein FliF/YscJ